MAQTPITPQGLVQFDDLDPAEAVLRAWLDEGSNPDWHRRMQNCVREDMPLLARHLDRLARS